MKPMLHGLRSVKKYGGKVEDYQEIHDFFDSTKAAFPDVRHRAILHNSFGIYLAEKVFGVSITNSDGLVVQVRDIGEDHVKEDLGTIPTLGDFLRNMQIQPWMGGKVKKRTRTFKSKLIEGDELCQD